MTRLVGIDHGEVATGRKGAATCEQHRHQATQPRTIVVTLRYRRSIGSRGRHTQRLRRWEEEIEADARAGGTADPHLPPKAGYQPLHEG